jgi:putative transcriptional regulator
MQTPNDPDIDSSRFGKKTRAEINAEAAEEKQRLGITGRTQRTVAVVNGKSYVIPDVRAIRTALGMTQQAFAARFHLELRTVQQWEQGRATPSLPAIILLKVIEQSPDVVASAASVVEHELAAIR